MDVANIEVALKNDRNNQERIGSKEVYDAKTPRAATESTVEFDSRAPTEFAEQRSEQQVFVPVSNQDQEEQEEIFVADADEEQPEQEGTTVLVQRLQDFEGVVMTNGNQLRVLDDTTARSLQQLQQHFKQEQIIPEPPRPPTTYPLLQPFQPVYYPGSSVNSLPGEVLQLINPVQQASLDQAHLGIRATPFSADLYRLIRMFPDFHSKTLHRILTYCLGDLKRAIDQTLFARQLRVIDLGPPSPYPQMHPQVHSAHHSAPYRIPRGAFPARTHSPLFLYPESGIEGYGSPVATPRRATVVQPTLQTGIVPPSGATPLAPLQTLPSFQSVFVPVFQTSKTQQLVQDTSRIVAPDVLMPEGMSAVHLLKLQQLNTTGIPERQEQVCRSSELESTIPMSVTSSHDPVQPIQTTVRRILEDGVLESIPVKPQTLNPKTQVIMTAEKVLDVGAGGDANTASSLLVKITDDTSEKQRSKISH